jgi:anti-anti-sigma factor
MKDGAFIGVTTDLQITELSMDGVAVLLAAGDLDVASAPALCARLAHWRGARIVLDLARTAFCDMAGLRAVTEELRAGRAAGGLFAIVAPEGCAARRLLGISGLLELVEVHDDRPRAIARVRPPR